MAPPRIQLLQAIWFLSRPWPHLDGWRELVVRAAFRFESDSPAAPAKKVIEGCSVCAVAQAVDEAQLAAQLDGAEAFAMALPMGAVIPWRAALEGSACAPVPVRLLSWAAADAGLRIAGLPLAQGFPLVWALDARRAPDAPHAEWLTLESDAGADEVVIPGVALQQHIALAQARGDDRVALRGPWERALTHIPQRESAMMADLHGDLYQPGADGPCVGGAGFTIANGASVAQVPGFGYGQTVETHRRMGIGRLRGR